MSTEAPPSYEAVMAGLDERLGPHPKAQEILKAIEQLPEYEKVVISEHPPIEISPLSAEQEKEFTKGAATAMSSPDGHEHLNEEARRINDAVETIRNMFLSLTQQLASLDKQYNNTSSGAFAPRLNYNKILQESRMLAISVAQYGDRFDKVIIPVVGNKTIDADRKLTMLDGYIKDAEKLQADSLKIEQDFDGVLNDFALLTGEFGHWAQDKRDAYNRRLQEVENQIYTLHAELESLRKSLIYTGAAAALAIPITGVVAFFSGPFAPFVILAGLVATGASTAAVVGIQVAIDVRESSLEGYKKEREVLKRSIQHIDTTQGTMEILAKENLSVFASNINILQGTWRGASADAQLIVNWLEAGQAWTDVPEVLQIHLDESIRIYEAMAIYLTNYAKGISPK